MTAAPALTFPGSRTVAGWWRQLAGYQPQALWIGHLLFHRVEALVSLASPRRPDRLTLLVIKALELGRGQPLDRLNERLHLGHQLLGQVLGTLRAEGLALVDADGRWSPTDSGRRALEQGEYQQVVHERRVFHFVETERPGHPPHFVRLGEHAGVFSPVGQRWQFDPVHLRACLGQPPGWKQEQGFPPEVVEVLAPGAAAGTDVGGAVQEWQRVILDQPERLLAALVLAPAEGGGERLLGFAARQPGWALGTAAPVVSLAGGWQAPFPELADEAPLEQWRQAWRAWGQPRGLPPPETDACRLERHDYRLRVAAPRHVVERLRLARSDALKGEAWLLAGDGRIRAAALVEVVEQAPASRGA
ncbi:MAG TPA: hypothetical protein VG013_09565 [Gemmataceae bacterium]|jgi:hypothetical protein|nr:hypothetical protein [Gemmataceae bacterium]